MKCLVLVMYCNQDFFLKEEKIVRETWAKDIIDNKFSDIDFYSYTASNNGKSYIDLIIKLYILIVMIHYMEHLKKLQNVFNY